MKNQISIKSIVTAIVAVIGAVGTFLPWLSTTVLGVSMTVNGSVGDGWISFVLFIIAFIVALISVKKEPATWAKVCISIVSVLAFLVAVIKIPSAISNDFTIGVGVYIVLIAGIITTIMPWLPIGKRN